MIKEEILIIENEFVEKIIREKKENLMELDFILIIYIYLIYFYLLYLIIGMMNIEKMI